MKMLLFTALVFMSSCASYVDKDVANRLYGHVYERMEKYSGDLTKTEMETAKSLKEDLAGEEEKIDATKYEFKVVEATTSHDLVVLKQENVTPEQKQIWLNTSEILRTIFKEAAK
jgi:hypothetical protein